MKRFVLFGVLALATVVLAAQQLDRNTSARITQILTGLVIGPDSVNATDARINANRITRSLGGSATIDFAGSALGCADSSAITVLGARVGDPCHVGAPASVGVADAGAKSTFSCYVSATNEVKVRFCTQSYENPASETYRVRVFSNQ